MFTTNQVANNQTFSILDHYYTGTEEHPDVVTVFFKPEGEIYSSDEQILNEMGYLPLHQDTFSTAISRIRAAAAREPSCNTAKNLLRAVVQLVPFLGNGVLYLYDLVRKNFFVHPQLKAELSGEQGVFGIAFDGKPVVTLPLSTFQTKFPSSYQKGKEKECAALLTWTWLNLRTQAFEENRNCTTLALAKKLERALSDGRPL